MASKIFSSAAIPVTNTTNDAGGKAYALSPEEALAQMAVTGCFGDTYYASAELQLSRVMEILPKVDISTIGMIAVYARRKGLMKDMPALLLAHLCSRGPEGVKLAGTLFNQIVDSGRMLRNFVQIIRSGVTGRKSMGTAPKRWVQTWLETRKDEALFRDSVGNSPSLADVIKMAHPKPGTADRAMFYKYLLGKVPSGLAVGLPVPVLQYELWKASPQGDPPDVPFQMLTALELSTDAWKTIMRNASWHTLRMNLNTFARHGVFQDKKMVHLAAQKLRDKEAITKAKVMPYQLLMAFKATEAGIPMEISLALQDAMEIATANVPAIDGQMYVLVDTSGSMGNSVTGYRKGATSAATCVDVAGLIASCFLRTNPTTRIVDFNTEARWANLNPRDSVMTNAKALARAGGGTNCGAALRLLNAGGCKGDLVVFVSDNESWLDSGSYMYRQPSTNVMMEWDTYKKRNPKAKLVCIDLLANTSTQAPSAKDRLNVGGFSDTVFEVVLHFAAGRGSWLSYIKEADF